MHIECLIFTWNIQIGVFIFPLKKQKQNVRKSKDITKKRDGQTEVVGLWSGCKKPQTDMLEISVEELFGLTDECGYL